MIQIGDMRFEDRYEAATDVLENGVLMDDWQEEVRLDGVILDDSPREWIRHIEQYIVDDIPVRVAWMFLPDEIEGKDMDDWPYDNGTLTIIVDGENVVEVE